jgi:hypothetical protein
MLLAAACELDLQDQRSHSNSDGCTQSIFFTIVSRDNQQFLASDVKILLKFVRPRLTGIAGRQLNICGAFLHQVPSRSFSSYYSFSFVCQQ